jgi:hypothetical protein
MNIAQQNSQWSWPSGGAPRPSRTSRSAPRRAALRAAPHVCSTNRMSVSTTADMARRVRRQRPSSASPRLRLAGGHRPDAIACRGSDGSIIATARPSPDNASGPAHFWTGPLGQSTRLAEPSLPRGQRPLLTAYPLNAIFATPALAIFSTSPYFLLSGRPRKSLPSRAFWPSPST